MIESTIPPAAEGQLISARQVCGLLSCSRVTLWRLLGTEDFPRAIRFHPDSPRSRLRFDLRSLIAWSRRQQVLSVDAAHSGATAMSIHLLGQ